MQNDQEIKTPMQQLIEAMVAVMSEVEYLRKDDTVGTGSSSYKGLTDEKVKRAVGKSLVKHKLVVVQSKVTPVVRTERWTEPGYKPTDAPKQKQQVFTELVVDYDIYHAAGACIQGQSYGHGVDSQDKGPGKAMTYAFKNFLLNCFCIPSGEDSDKIHSDTVIPKTVTMEHINAHLHNGGRITAADVNKCVKNWLANSRVIYFEVYVHTISNGKEFWFMLSDEQIKIFKQALHG